MASSGNVRGGSGRTDAAAANPGTTALMYHFAELLECMICFESYRNPKMLKCTHSFCAECLVGYLKTYQQQRRAVPGKLPCPTCRELTTLPHNGVVGLRNDFKAQKMEDMFRTMNVRRGNTPGGGDGGGASNGGVSRGAVSGSCGACEAQKKSSKAHAFCNNCAINYCESCLKRHNKNAVFKNHKVIVKSTGANSGNAMDGLGQLAAVADLQCKTHRGERGKFMCVTCETVVCTLCIIADHCAPDHEVVELTAIVRQQQNEVSALKVVVESRMDVLRRRVTELTTLRRLNSEACQRAEAAIKDKAEKTVQAVRARQASLQTELRKMRDDKVAAIDAELERVEYNVSKANRMDEYSNNMTSPGSNALLMMAMHDELVQRMRTVADASSGTTAGLDALQAVVTFLPSRQDVDLGRIDEMRGSVDELQRNMGGIKDSLSASNLSVNSPQRPVSAGISSQNSSSAPVLPALSQNGVGRPRLLMHIATHGSRPGELKDPLSVVALLNGDLAVTEWGNKRVQIFSSAGRSVRIIAEGLVGPQGVAVTLKGNIIITDTQQKRLQVFSPSGETLSKWGLGKFFSPCGIAVSPNGNFVITDTGDSTVNIYRGEKTCLCRFGTRGAGDQQFDNPLYISTGPHNEIVVSDSDNHCLKLFDSSGHFVRRVGSGQGSGDGQLKFPRGVCCDGDGNIVVADRNNDRVSQFTAGGQFVKHLLTKDDGVRAPYAVAINGLGHLVVTESGVQRAAIKIFQW